MSWVNRTMCILLKNLVISTGIVWVFILLDLVVHDLSRDELKSLVSYILQSLNTLFTLDLIAPILILTIVLFILGLLNRARNTLIIEDVQRAEKKNDKKEKKDEKKGSPNYHLILIEELNRIYQIYSDVDEQRPIKTSMAEKCDITSASLRAGSLDSLLNSATLAETAVTLGPVSVPSNFLLSLTNRVLKGPRLLLSVDREDRTVRLSAVLTSPKNLSWQVTRTIPHAPPTEEHPDNDMVRELACRIFTGMTRGKTQRWEATEAFVEGLENYRKGLRSPKDQIFYLKEAEDKFFKALGYDEGYKFAWYNLGVVYSEMKRHDAAEKAFSRAAEIDHSQWEPYYAKAVNARHQIITDTERTFCKAATQKCPPLQDRTPDPAAKYQEIIAHLDQAERVLKKKRRNDVSEVFMVRGETYLRIYRMSKDQDDLDQGVSDLREATLAGWRRYRAHLASSPTTVSELAREETACRLMQESLSSLAYAYAHTNRSEAECLISHAISIDPTCPEVYFTCGRIHLMEEQKEKAVRAFRTATEIAPQRMKYCLALAIAECLTDADKIDGCPQVIEKKIGGCLQIIDGGSTNDTEMERELCAEVSEEEWIEIDEMVKDLKSEDPKNKCEKKEDQDKIRDDLNDLHALCCKVHKEEITDIATYSRNKKSELHTTWQQYWEEPLTFQEHYDLARLHYQEKRYRLAIQFLETTLPLRPQDPRASEYIGIASVQYVLSSHPRDYATILEKGEKNLENALQIYRHRIYKILEAESNAEVFLKGIVRTYYWLGRLLSIKQRYPEAIEKFQLATQLAEDSCRGYTSDLKTGLTSRLAWAYLRNQDYDLAEIKFRETILLAENHLHTDLSGDLEDEIKGREITYCSYLGLAYSFFLRGIAPDETKSYLNKAKKIEEKNAPRYSGCHASCLGLYEYTRSHSDPGDKRRCLEESITLLTKGLEGRPTAGKYLALARACISCGELEGSKPVSERKPTEEKYTAMAKTYVSFGALKEEIQDPEEEENQIPEEKPVIPAKMPYLSRAQECLARAREMDHFRRHADEIERLSTRVERCLKPK
ncbi:tetratricopeptide (TPR) repeat protein [Methanofollis sp. W23]|uniref:tetratricopeptide repeat protein n=1 Tax=Methanofollis sp. W23 TaxID=2817849 RepID=UPI001AE13941|nr:tetratricopeptide repeat protein [Methanofollis sp. W23]MBP2146293.1 tetratricopeptide (TPR) repeat protein [Methanofollis sp. W23]